MSSNQKLLFWLILLTGIFFRLYNLGLASYQIDEINIVRDAVQAPTAVTIWNTELDRFTWYHRLPFTMMAIHLFNNWFGTGGPQHPSEFIARLPFTLIGILALPIFYGLGRRLAGVRTGLWAMALACLSTFQIFYSREAYDYSLLTCLTAGVLWAGLEILEAIRTRERFPWAVVAAYNILATLLLFTHLSGLITLAMWCVVLAVMLLMNKPTRSFGKFVPAVVALGLPYIFFLPFLWKLLFGGWVDSDSGAMVDRIRSTILADLLGRMGWGQAWWALLPFVAALAFGIWFALRKGTKNRDLAIALLVHLAVGFVVQAWMLRVARFEIRYFAAIQPTLLLFVAIGMASLGTLFSARFQKIGQMIVASATVLLVVWLGMNAWAVIQLQSRGSNFKSLANWVNTNLPKNGIYCFFNGYELRGVPAFYDTPERFATFPITWSTAADYKNYQVRERMISMFQRFPTMVYAEYQPSDILAPSRADVQPVPRNELFMRQLWLTDPAYEKLVKWKTLPLGDTQWNNEFMDRVLISYNLPEDLPELARRQGRVFYHFFGDDWRYYKDQQMNDWLLTSTSASLTVGNNSDQPALARLRILVAAAPKGGRLNLYAPGRKLLENVEIGAQPREIVVDRIPLLPGDTRLLFEILPPAGTSESTLLMHGVEVLPATPGKDAS